MIQTDTEMQPDMWAAEPASDDQPRTTPSPSDSQPAVPVDIASDTPLHDTTHKPKPARRRSAASARKKPSSASSGQKVDPHATALVVAASRVIIHPDLGIDVEEFATTYADQVEQIVDQVRRGHAPMRPQVMALSDGRFGAVTELEVIAAYTRLAARNDSLNVAVILVTEVHAASRVVEQLSMARGRSGWEQYSALAQIFAGTSVRGKLRELELDVARWESKVSKVMKVGDLDPDILAAVVRLTIPVKEAGQVVDAWKSADKRAAMGEVLAAERRGSNQPLDARLLFKAMLSAGRPEVVEAGWREADGGAREYVTADGAVLAKVTIIDGHWTAEGGPMSATQWQSLTKGMPRPSKP